MIYIYNNILYIYNYIYIGYPHLGDFLTMSLSGVTLEGLQVLGFSMDWSRIINLQIIKSMDVRGRIRGYPLILRKFGYLTISLRGYQRIDVREHQQERFHVDVPSIPFWYVFDHHRPQSPNKAD